MALQHGRGSLLLSGQGPPMAEARPDGFTDTGARV